MKRNWNEKKTKCSMQQGHMNKVCERGRECETEKIKVGLRQQTMNYYFNTTLQEK